jgi:hypothetical protein
MLSFREFLTEPELSDREITRQHLQYLAGILEGHIHYHHVPEFDQDVNPDTVHPYLWYGQSQTQGETLLNCSSLYPDIIGVNVEIYSTDPSMSEVIEEHCVAALSDYGNPRSGSPFGSSLTVHDVIVGSQDDDYIPVGNRFNNDIVWHIQSFQVSIYPLWCSSNNENRPAFGYY